MKAPGISHAISPGSALGMGCSGQQHRTSNAPMFYRQRLSGFIVVRALL
jgi:hypothetical protein